MTDFPDIDFSHAGYGGGGVALPAVPSVLLVRPGGGDNTERLQAALDRVAGLPAGEDGFRGAVQLAPGTFRVAGRLRLRGSGVVLRGSEETTILATGGDRRTLIEIGGKGPAAGERALRVTDAMAPAGSRVLTLESVEGLRAGDRIVITRPSTSEWIAALGMNTAEGAFAALRLHWQPGSRNLVWDRVLAAVDPGNKQIVLDAPITTALEGRFGGATVMSSGETPRRIGIEALSLESEWDRSNARDEEHAWIGVALDGVGDAWVRGVTLRHFAGSAVRVGPRARRVTVERCRSEQPISEIGGYRRQSFLVEGQQTLVRRCFAEAGLNDFAAGLCAGGPNVFLDCVAIGALGPSGSFEGWSSGVLYERVRIEGAGLRLTWEWERAQGAGWTAANSVIWNCEATEIEAVGPKSAPNSVRIAPEALYETQLARRVGAQPLIAAIAAPAAELPVFEREWRGATGADALVPGAPLEIVNGRFVIGGRVVWGGSVNGAWWRGQASPAVALDCGVSITRFVPGRAGPGLTEDLAALAERMAAEGTPFYQNGPGLWYDRRRDEHSIVPRADGNVWAPFYEMPWARSGEGTAWDGLSRYDLARYNLWYFQRTRDFADLCERHGLVLTHNLYNTHNLLESGSHWVDFPWRSANCLNDTGLPEPPPFEARNAIHVADTFYSVDHPGRRALHRAYILHTLDQLGTCSNVLFGLGFQFSGPLAFQQFFGEVVAEWEEKTGRRVRLVLTTSKDITDAILADPRRAGQIAVIDMRYWQYRPDGSLWAPPGDGKLAFRERIGREFGHSGDTPPDTTPEQAYREVREYRDRFPDRAIVAWHNGVGPLPTLMAGGAQVLMRNPAAGQGQGREVDRTPLDAFVREHLAAVLMTMTPRDGLLGEGARTWCLADAGLDAILIYSLAGPAITLAQPLPSRAFRGVWFDPRTGGTQPLRTPVSGKIGSAMEKPTEDDWLLLLKAPRG